MRARKVRAGLIGGIGVLALGAAIYATSSAQQKAQPPRAAAEASRAVIVTKAERRNVPVSVEGLGTIQAFNRVVVKPRVAGQIVDLAFTEGQYVKTGDVLAHIDPKPFAAALKQAQSTKEKDEAQLTNARRDLTRTSDLAKKGYSADQALDTQKATVDSQEANVDADEAAIEAAQIQLDYATVRSPLSGVTGIRMIDAGNVIQPSDPGIVSVAQLEPISLIFTLPANAIQTLPVGRPKDEVRVEILSADRSKTVEVGSLSLVDNAIDPSTSMVKLKATFSNTDHALKPGQFVNARLCLTTRQNVVTIPPASVQRDQDSAYVYVVDQNSRVKRQPVTIDETANSGVVIVTAGLDGGETVVEDGQYGLADNTLVAVANAAQGQVAEQKSSLIGLP